jgi:hypothetical protein
MGCITQERLIALLRYEPSTGNFYWIKTGTRVKAGQIAGTTGNHGYRAIKIDGSMYLSHRLAWLYVHGDMPKHGIDHINRIGVDNRLCNLREATASQNMVNRRLKTNTSGFIGASYHKGHGKYSANISIDGKKKHLGYFESAEDAHKKYIEASTKQRAEFIPTKEEK